MQVAVIFWRVGITLTSACCRASSVSSAPSLSIRTTPRRVGVVFFTKEFSLAEGNGCFEAPSAPGAVQCQQVAV